MNWSIVLGAMAVCTSIIGVTGGFIFLVLKLMVNPINATLEAMAASITKISEDIHQAERRIKPEAELATMISLAIHEHAKECAILKERRASLK